MRRRRRQPAIGLMEIGVQKSVIRPVNSRFKSLLEYRAYFLLRLSTKYNTAMVKGTSRMNRRVDGEVQGQDSFSVGDTCGVFTSLTTFRCACDAAELTYGQVIPLMAFLRSGAAKRSFPSAANTVVLEKRYELSLFSDGVNWLLKKYATHAALATAYHDTITLSQLDTEVPRVFNTRVEAACDRLCGLFNAQGVKDVIINGLSNVIKQDAPHTKGQPNPHANDICYNCNELGHFASGCPKLRRELLACFGTV